MGQVAAVHHLMPDSTDFDLEGLSKKLPTIVPEGVKVVRSEVKPLAFGLSMLEVTTIMLDSGGLIEKLEETYRSVEGIQNVETVEVGLI
ncbi:MAG TPA: elongation factor 1-beta [Methanomassiliicoccales archaeon]|jgi:elongation factor 1-beta